MDESLKDIPETAKDTPALSFRDIDLSQPISVRYKEAAIQVLENLRRHGEMYLTETMRRYNCLLPERPTEEELSAWQKFREDIYPALPRLKDLRAKTLEALHEKKERLRAETVPNLTQLLKTLDHDIEEITQNKEQKATTNNIFIFSNEQAQRIAARLTGRDGQINRYESEE